MGNTDSKPDDPNAILIAQLQSENERLKAENQYLKSRLEESCCSCCSVVKPPVSLECTEIDPKIHRVIKRVLEFLSWHELREIFVLCKDIYKKIHCEEFYIQVCKEKLKYTIPNELTTENLIEEFNKLTGLRARSHLDMFNMMKETYNFIKNPDARNGFDNWTSSEGYGKIITIENNWFCFKDKPNIFCTSFESGFISQRFKIPMSRKPKRLLIVGMLACRRHDCGSVATFKVNINEESTTITRDLEEFIAPKFELLVIKKEIGNEAIKVKVTCEGKDKNWWAGNYGARIGFCYAYVLDNLD
jgi:hypothetical protein